MGPLKDIGANAGVWVEDQCRELGVSVRKVAMEAGVDRTTIYRWKRGVTDPRWQSIRQIHSVISGYWARHERQKGFLDGSNIRY